MHATPEGRTNTHDFVGTVFPARLRVLAEDAADRARPLAVNAAAQWPIAEIPAQFAITYSRDF